MQAALEIKENKHNSVSYSSFFRAFPTILSLNSTFTGGGVASCGPGKCHIVFWSNTFAIFRRGEFARVHSRNIHLIGVTGCRVCLSKTEKHVSTFLNQ